MNAAPLLLLAALSQQSLRTLPDVSESSVTYKGRGKSQVTPFFNTFRMELLLDNLNNAVATLENVNKINQMVYETRQMTRGVRKSGAAGSSPESNSANAVNSPNPMTSLGSLLNPNNIAYLNSIMNALKSSTAPLAYPSHTPSAPSYPPQAPPYTPQSAGTALQDAAGGFNTEDLLRLVKTIGPVISAMSHGSNT